MDKGLDGDPKGVDGAYLAIDTRSHGSFDLVVADTTAALDDERHSWSADRPLPLPREAVA